MTDYQPSYDEHGIGWCDPNCRHMTTVGCDLCELLPNANPVCIPWATDAARDKRAMDQFRGRKWQIYPLNGEDGFAVRPIVGKKTPTYAPDPATAILKAAGAETGNEHDAKKPHQ